MRITDTWISDPDLQAVLHVLTAGGQKALLVGGCVRNALLKEPIDDLDIATDAVPQRVIELMQDAGLRTVPTGMDHGTVTVIAGGKPHEVTTFRRDIETDGRRAKVAFSRAILDDAARRDFTMNALYADKSGRIVDPLGGLPDLLSRRVRFVGDPAERIQEDYLRILRFFRFHARYGDASEGLDPAGLAACARYSYGLDKLSRERIGNEMRKLLAAREPGPALAAMNHAGILAKILPGANTTALTPLIHLEGHLPPDPIRRLAVIGGEDPIDRLKLSRAEGRQLSQMLTAAAAKSGPAELAYRFGEKLALDILLVRSAMARQHLPNGYEEAMVRGASAKFPVKPADLSGIAGPALGNRLKELEDSWIASGFELSREQLLS